MASWMKWTFYPLLAAALAGCADTEKLQYVINETDDISHYVVAASKIDYAHVHHETDRDTFSRPPRTIDDLTKDDVRDFSLAECLELALQNARIIRTGSSFLSGGNPILSNPTNAPSIYDPAIQETGVLFGGRGVEAALAAFDAQFTTQATWGRSESVRNAGFVTGGFNETTANSANVVSQLAKTFAYGGQFQVGQEVNYSRNNTPGLFGSSYDGNINASYRHPLLAGAGTEFTQIAGPISSQFGGLSGVNQGVVIARINHDITLADFEQDMVNLLKDVEDAYWNLYLQYRVYDTQVKSRQSARKSWSDAKAKLDQGGAPGFRVEDEPIARDAYFQTKVLTEEGLSELYKSETALRRLIGLPVNDGAILRPSDEPMTAAFKPDWAVSIAEGLTHRVEIRRHKWNIKSLELQLLAAEGLVKPRLDLVASYQVNGFGDHLIKDNRNSFSSYAGTITDNNHTGWTAGAIFEMPLGLRSARTQVQNLELRLRKAREVLGAQEHDISHELAIAYQELAEKYRTARSNFNRRDAAAERKRILFLKVQRGTETIEEYLRSVASYAEAEIAYYRSLVSYSQAVTNLQFRQGTLLQHNSITLSEGEWEPEAYVDALRRARARSNAFDAESMLHTEPLEFVETEAHWNDDNSHEGVLTIEPLPVFDGEPADEAAAPAEAKPAEAKPAEAKPAEVKPAEAKPAEVKPAEVKPAEAKPTEAKPTEAKPTEAKPTVPALIPPAVPASQTPPLKVEPAQRKPGTASIRPAMPQSPPASFLAVPSPLLREALQETGSRHLKPAQVTTKLPADNGSFLPPVRASSTKVQTR